MTPRTDVLAVDDDPANLVAIEAALSLLAVRLVVVGSGEEALRQLLRQEFAVILLDVRMPSLDGFETARLIRGRARTRHMPIIFMTAYSQDDIDVGRGYELGAVDYLFKPIVAEVLQAKVGVFVDLQKRAEEIASQADTLRALERSEALAHLERERRAWEAAALRRQMTEQRELNERLEEADRRKDDFLAMLAHELRNPLAPIVASLELLRLRSSDDPRLSDAREIMVRQVGHLTRMVDDLLDVSRIAQGKIDLEIQTVDLRTVIESSVESCRPVLDERRMDLALDGPSEETWLKADLVRLTQVMSNLLTNACRYSDPGGHIRISWWTEEDRAVLRVADDGQGMSPELVPRVFDRFVQERKEGRGLGLGLALVKQLVELHGGTVEASSEGLGRGSELTVRLPVTTAPPVSRAARPPAPSGAATRALDVVIIEDDGDIRRSLQWLCDEWGHATRVAEDGESGLEATLARPPDVALVDIGLPGIDGFTVAKRVREALGAGSPRLVALSGYGQEADRAKSTAAGFDAHLVKPAPPETLRAALAPAEGQVAAEA